MHENIQKHQDKQGSKQKKKGSIKRKRYCWTTGDVLQGEELSKRLRQELLHAYTMYYYSLHQEIYQLLYTAYRHGYSVIQR